MQFVLTEQDFSNIESNIQKILELKDILNSTVSNNYFLDKTVHSIYGYYFKAGKFFVTFCWDFDLRKWTKEINLTLNYNNISLKFILNDSSVLTVYAKTEKDYINARIKENNIQNMLKEFLDNKFSEFNNEI